MQFVAHKLGFLKVQSQQTPGPANPTKQPVVKIEQQFPERRKTSNDDSSSNSSIGFTKLKITDSSDSDPNEPAPAVAPTLRPPPLSTQSLNLFPPMYDFTSFIPKFPLSTTFQYMGSFSNDNDFYYNNYLSSMIMPYGTPVRFIGPITEFQRKEKVSRYLEKKKNRQWKSVKYNVRKELAEGRKRVQGRFVKSERRWKWNEIAEKQVEGKEQKPVKDEQIEEKEGEEVVVKMQVQ